MTPHPGASRLSVALHQRSAEFRRLIGLLTVVALAPSVTFAHGTLLEPPSRVYLCRFEDDPSNPADPACAAAIAFAGDTQFLDEWAGIAQSNANGQHQVVLPDGELCSGGSGFYGGLDLPRDDWRATPIAADAQGNFEFVYWASIPHDTDDMVFFITRQGWDPSQPVTWDDLDLLDDPGDPEDPADPFCRLTSVTQTDYPEDPAVDDVYRMLCPLPERTGRHVIFHVWQRGDSAQAFYGCIDVDFGGEGGDPIFEDDFETGNASAWSLP